MRLFVLCLALSAFGALASTTSAQCQRQPELVNLGYASGSARLSAAAPEVFGALSFLVEGAEANQPGCVTISLGSTPTFDPFLGLTLVPDPRGAFVKCFRTDYGGNALPLYLPNLPPAFCGAELFAQAVMRDTRAASTIVSTNALRIRAGRDRELPAISAPVGFPIVLGDRAEFEIVATDIDGRRLPVGMEPLPLPRNAFLDSMTGRFVFSPDELQIGEHELTIVAAGRSGVARRSLRLPVSQRPGSSPTEISGVVLDSATAAPIPGVSVRIQGTSLRVTTGSDGRFAIGPIPQGARTIEIDGVGVGWTYVAEDIALVLEHMLLERQNNIIHRPIYLPQLGPVAGQVVPSQRSILRNGMGVEVAVEAQSARLENGTLYSGPMYMPEVPRERTPAALPDTLQPAFVIAIQPAGLRFNPPAAVTFPNPNNLPEGSEANIWSIDPISGEFRIVAVGTVQGGLIRSNPGQGIENSSWHFVESAPAGAAPPAGESPGANDDPWCGADRGSSFVSLQGGSLGEDHALVTYRSLGEERGLRLVYNSRAATARPIISADLSLSPRTATPLAFRATVELGGTLLPTQLYFAAPGTNDRSAQRVGLQIDGSDYATGFYPYRLRLTSIYPQSESSSDVFGGVAIHNLEQSPYGAGWSIAGVERLFEQADGSISIDEGDGGVVAFRAPVLPAPGLAMYMFRLQTLGEIAQGFANRTPGLFQVTTAFDSYVTDRFIVPVVNFPDSLFDTTSLYSVGENGTIDAGSTVAAPRGDDKSFQPPGGNDLFGTSFVGYLRVPTGGTITFRIGVDDSFVFFVGGNRVAEHLPGTAFRYFTVNVPNVPAGYVPIRLDFAENFGEASIVLEASGGGLPGGVIPRAFLQTAVNAGADLTYDAPPGDFSTLIKRADGSYERRAADGTRTQFNARGLQIAVLDRNQNATTFEYDTSDRLTVVRDPVGLETRFTYQGGLLARIDHPGLGQPTICTHVGRDLVRISDPDGSERSFTYDAEHRLVGQRDKRGFDTIYRFGPGDALVEAEHVETRTKRQYAIGKMRALVINPGSTSLSAPAPIVRSAGINTVRTDRRGYSVRVDSHSLGEAATVIDALGRRTSWSRNEDGLPEQTTYPNGRIDTANYDERGNLLRLSEAVGQPLARTRSFTYLPGYTFATTYTDPNSAVTRYGYDVNGNLLTETDALLGVRRFTYTARGLIETATDELGRVTRFAYDANGRLERMTDALGFITRYTYDGRGNALSITEALGTSSERTTRFTYDVMNRMGSRTDGAGGTQSFLYDAAGNLIESMRPTGERTFYEYDSMGNLARIKDPVQGELLLTYDPEGNLLSRTDGLGRRTTYAYDAAAQLTGVVDAIGGAESYAYDASGNVERFRNALGFDTLFAYDPFDRRISMTTPEGRIRRWSYDNRDNLIQEIPPGTPAIGHDYDPLSRLTTTRVPAVISGGVTVPANTINRIYDSTGNLRFIADSDSSLEFRYDALNRTESALTLAAGMQPVVTLTSSFDGVGNRASLADSLGGLRLYGHDAAGRLNRVQPPLGGAITLSHDASGRMTRTSFPNGVGASYTYAPGTGRLASIIHRQAGQSPILSLAYEQSPVGTVTQISEPGHVWKYWYDALDRVIGATAPNQTESYAYDGVGNRRTSHLSSAHRHNRDNQLLEDDQFFYTYDSRGNMATKRAKPNGPTTTFVWDAQNQLVQVIGISTYRYDGLGRRTEKAIAGGVTRRYVYDGDHIALEFDGANQLLAQYTHGEAIDQVLAQTRAGSTYYYHADHLGSVRRLTDASGAVSNLYDYASYGSSLGQPVEVVENPFWYTGREEAREASLLHYRARLYDSNSGRFSSGDPAEDIGTDYLYVHSSPTNYTDPDGRVAVPVLWALGSAYGLYRSFQVARGAYAVYNLASTLGGAREECRVSKSEHWEFYHDICDQPEPPGLDKCESAKFRRDRAQQCIRERFLHGLWYYEGTFDEKSWGQIRQRSTEMIRAQGQVYRHCK